MNNKKAIALISGGLDSILAAKIVNLQNIEVLGLHLTTPLWNQQEAIRNAKELNIPLEIVDISKSFLKILGSSHQQWCIMCRILMLKEAKKYLEKEHASFIITGEVVGQNPKSQSRKILNLTAQKANVEGIILRPLSGHLFPITIPEEKGWIRREKLLGIHGAKRTPQLELATCLGLSKELTSTKGCLLTNNTYLRRLKDLLKYGHPQVNDLELLKLGRHLRLSNTTKIIIARSQLEETRMSKLITKNDLVLKIENCPFTIMQGESINEENIIKAATLYVKYSKVKYLPSVTVKYRYLGNDSKEYSVVIPTLTGEK
ncbi:MAG: tRNA 4-thiouridine(8) synthase ThiI [bacterium]